MLIKEFWGVLSMSPKFWEKIGGLGEKLGGEMGWGGENVYPLLHPRPHKILKSSLPLPNSLVPYRNILCFAGIAAL